MWQLESDIQRVMLRIAYLSFSATLGWLEW